MSYFIDGIKGKDRPRFFKGHTFTPTATKEYEQKVKNSYTGQFYETEHIRVNIIAYYKIANNTTKKKRKEIKDGLEYPKKKPDIDNIVKIILDGLNKVAYADDKQVVEVTALKRYTEQEDYVEYDIIAF